VRAELGDALREPYVRTARAKGASRARAALAHALPNALVPVAQLSVLELGALVGGALVTEKLFRWPGLGEMAVTAIQARDAQAVVGVTLVSAAAITAATLLADVVTLLLDPRLRRSQTR
jgi:peptide/nickel transport system permease protein